MDSGMAFGDLVGGVWLDARTANDAVILQSCNPAHSSRVVWSGASSVSNVALAVVAARAALPAWRRAGEEKRFAALKRFATIATSREAEMAALIRDEVGKVYWDALAEAKLLATKVSITLDPRGAWARVAGFDVAPVGTRAGRCVFKPHGVAAVVGPYNFPAHLPNGHIVPALAIGNTVVFKPSDKAPGVGRLLGSWLHEAIRDEIGDQLAAGVVNVVQGGADVARALVSHEGIDAIMFTGSWPVGRAIMQANLDRPGRLVALEMGGNNAAVVLADADPLQALTECVRCAFITTGQRCTCTRRIIVQRGSVNEPRFAEKFIEALCKGARDLTIGDPADTSKPIFMGPLVSAGAMNSVLASFAAMQRAGGQVLVPCERLQAQVHDQGWFVSPGVVRVDRFEAVGAEAVGAGEGGASGLALWAHAGIDEEIFGPVVRVSVVNTLDEAIEQANATRFGLAASIFTTDNAAAERFFDEARAGCININTGTAGASSALPFGGLGLSGNHRPAGAFSLDYSGYPVASMRESGDVATGAPGMTVAWHA